MKDNGKLHADRVAMVGPAGLVPPGQPAKPSANRLDTMMALLSLAVAGSSLGALAAEITPTQALMTSRADAQHNSVSAGKWGPQTPPASAECDALDFDAAHTIVLTAADSPFTAPKPQGSSGFLIFGTDGNDVINGSNQNDCIVGGGGNDTISGEQGDDILLGGDGNDTLSGDQGSDTLYGGAGNDTLNGDNAPDHGLFGGSGDDTINGDNGPDTVDGGDGTDHCNGGSAPDALTDCEFADGTPVALP